MSNGLLSSLPGSIGAYPVAWPQHLQWLTQAKRWHRRGRLSTTRLSAIREAFPVDFYRPAWPIRVALFCFTLLGVVLGSTLLLSPLLFNDAFRTAIFLVLLASSAALEFMIRQKRYYHAGPDNALLYIALASAATWIGRTYELLAPSNLTFSLDNPLLILPLTVGLALLLLAVARYADRGVAAAAFFTGLLILINLLLSWPIGRSLLPFALMGAAAAAAYLARQRSDVSDAAYYYEGCRRALRLLAWATFYLAGNYLVIREGRVALLGIDYAGPPPLGWFFIAFTALVPLAYIVQGLRRADRMLLVLGLLAVGFSVFTLRFYRSLMPAPLAATLAGAVLSAGAGAALRYLRPGRHGLTSTPDAAEEPAPDDAANPLSPANLEALVTAHANPAAAPAPAPGLEFGGGQFGGGGASSNY